MMASSMSWFRLSSLIFAAWAGLFFLLPGFSNQVGGIGYVPSDHAEDWTQLVGLFSLGFGVLLNEAHHSPNPAVHRIVARGVLACTLPCALLTSYWQIIPDGRWIRLDLLNVALLFVMSYGMFLHADLPWLPAGGTRRDS